MQTLQKTKATANFQDPAIQSILNTTQQVSRTNDYESGVIRAKQSSQGGFQKHTRTKDVSIKAISKALKRRLEATSHLIDLEEDPELIAHQKYSSMCKVINVDVRSEYRNHLRMMDSLRMFKQLRPDWDHAFYKCFVLSQPEAMDEYKRLIGTQMLSNQDLKKFHSNLKIDSEKILQEDFFSIVEPSLRSSLSSLQERAIPNKPIALTQNKKMVALWHEVKNHFAQDQSTRSFLTQAELLKMNSQASLHKYFSDLLKIVERWMRIMCEEEGEVVGAMVVDLVFKNAMIKLDQVFSTQEEFMDQEHEVSNSKVNEMRRVAKDKMNLLLKHFEISEQKYVAKIEELNRQIKAQSKEIESLHQIIKDETQKFNSLISRQGREDTIKDLQTSFSEITNLIKDQEEHHGVQFKLLN